MSTNIIPRRPSKNHDRAYKKLELMGIIGEEVFTFDNWEDILRYAYTNEDTGFLYPIKALKNRSAAYFRNTGYKRSVAFRKLYDTNKGRLLSLVVEVGGGILRSKKTHDIIEDILDHRAFKDTPLMYNTQRGQGDNSIHLHILCYWPNSRNIPSKIRGFTLRSDVELSKGEYLETPVAISIRKFVQYLRFPEDQRYRSGARIEAYREAFLDYLARRESGFTLPNNTMRFSGERNMFSILLEVTYEEAALELERFEEFQRAKEDHRLKKLRDSTQPDPPNELPYNPTVVTQESLFKTVQYDENYSFETLKILPRILPSGERVSFTQVSTGASLPSAGQPP